MKKKRFTEAQIVSILHQQEVGKSVKDISREHGISDATFYNWKAKYGGMQVSDVKRMKELEEENSRLKRIVANQTLEIDAIKTVLEKKSKRYQVDDSSNQDLVVGSTDSGRFEVRRNGAVVSSLEGIR